MTPECLCLAHTRYQLASHHSHSGSCCLSLERSPHANRVAYLGRRFLSLQMIHDHYSCLILTSLAEELFELCDGHLTVDS